MSQASLKATIEGAEIAEPAINVDPAPDRPIRRCAACGQGRTDPEKGDRYECKRSAAANVVLVHGGFVDGSGWRAVYDLPTQDGYHVAVVQNPTLSLQGDAASRPG